MPNVSLECVNVRLPAEAHQEQVHGVEAAELLRDDRVAGGAGVQQGRHQSSNVQARVPKWLLQHAQRRKHGASLNMAGKKTVRGPSETFCIASVYSFVFAGRES